MAAKAPHGALACSQRGCKCIDCRCASSEYFAAFRNGKRTLGPILHLNVPAVKQAMARQGLSHEDVGVLIGLKPGTPAQWMKRGGITLYNADKLAVALGTHYSLIAYDDVVSVA